MMIYRLRPLSDQGVNEEQFPSIIPGSSHDALLTKFRGEEHFIR